MNYDENNQSSIKTFVLNNLPRHKQFSLATVSNDGKPWVVCLNTTYTEDLKYFIWKSDNDTAHSQHIAANPNVSICVYSETEDIGDFGLYATGLAHEITSIDELHWAIDERFSKKGRLTPDVSEFSTGKTRLYVFAADRVWVNDDRHMKVELAL